MSASDVGTIGQLIERPRLNELLLGRFDHRLTTIIGVAGSGKTSAILRSIENNRVDPRGIDIFVGLHRSSDDSQQLLTQITLAAGLTPEPNDSTDDLLAQIGDWVWSHAPDDVTIVLDDAHLITSPDPLDCLSELVARLPRNGHITTTSRAALGIPTARLRAHGQLLVVTDDELALDDDELATLSAARGGSDADDLPRHAATADLQLAAGPEAGADFLREEVLSALDPLRLEHLRRLSVFDEFDDELVQAVTNGTFDAAAVLGRLPLVESRSGGKFRLHALLHEALAVKQPNESKLTYRTAGAKLLRARGDFAQAVQLHLLAGDQANARETAREVLLLSGVQQAAPASRRIRRLLDDVESGSALLAMFDATLHGDGRPSEVVPRFEAAATQARASGDGLLETLALFRAAESQMLDGDADEPMRRYGARLTELMSTVPLATSVHAHISSTVAEARGHATEARELLDRYESFDTALPGGMRDASLPYMMRHNRLCDLGRPEEVGLGLTPDDLASLPDGAEVMISFAMWLRGDASPELADEVVSDIVKNAAGRGQQPTTISTLGVATTIALAAGSTRAAALRSEQTRGALARGAPSTVALFADVAAASVAADAESDEAAAALLDPDVCGLGIEAWPHRPHLLALPLIYVTRPETRATLDRCDFGPSLRTAVAAGRALVALRERGDTTLAAELPWTQRNLLRVHLLPHHLVELACAAQTEAIASIDDMLAEIPDLSRHLQRAANSPSERVASHASNLLEQLPAQAPCTIHALLLGPPELMIDGALATTADWPKRSRVRELFAVLVDRRRVERSELLEMLWPEHADERKADANLRTNLWKLQNVLEPNRVTGAEPYFIKGDGENLTLHDDVTSDIDEFDELLTSARRLDEAGSPAVALDHYVAALDLVRGDYLAGFDAGWAMFTRLRIRSQVLSATCRVAELVGARGEPEAALDWATRARQLDPLSDRAARAFVAAIHATGNRSAVREAAADFERTLSDEGLTPEPATVRAFARLR